MDQYGAHGVGIGWRRLKGEQIDQVALIFYVERKGPGEVPRTVKIPERISFTPSGMCEPVVIVRDVVETPPASFVEEAA